MVKGESARHTSNLRMLAFVADKLAHLREKLIFLGGSATSLFITDPGAPDVRSTLDVDCIVDVISFSHYHQLERELMSLGFKRSIQDSVICRWHFEDIILDVMPTDEKILGFSNCWYKPAIQHCMQHQLTDSLTIQSVTAPYFLATKLEAFKGRGNQDYLASHDLEDIIAIIDGRSEIISDIEVSELSLQQYLSTSFNRFLNNPEFLSALPGHLNDQSMARERMNIVVNRLKNITAIWRG